MMKELFCITIIIFSTCSISGQVLTAEFGPTYVRDKSQVKLHSSAIGQESKGGNDDWFYQFTYGQWVNSTYIITGSFSKYPDATWFHLKNDKRDLGAYGWKANVLYRADIGLGWNIFKNKKMVLIPSVAVGMLFARPTGDGIVGYIPRESLPSGFEQTKPVEAEAYRNTQVVPSIGLKAGYAFWNRLELFIDFRQVFGFKKTQQLTLAYTYQGIQQPDAINYSDGTGRFYALGIGYRIVKPN